MKYKKSNNNETTTLYMHAWKRIYDGLCFTDHTFSISGKTFFFHSICINKLDILYGYAYAYFNTK